MRNVELVVQVKHIETQENIINSDVKNKTIIDFDVCSYADKFRGHKNIFANKNNKLLLFTNMSDFAKKNITEEDYILVKGDLINISEEENIFLPTSIKLLNKKKPIRCKRN